MARTLSLLIFAAMSLWIGESAVAQLPQVAESRLGVDRLTLKSGQKLFGFILDSNADETVVAVEREWLRTTHPERYQEYIALEQREMEASVTELKQRVQQWIEERQDNAGFQRYLAFQLSQVDKKQTTASESAFMRLQLTKDQIEQSMQQPPERRHVAGIAYQHDLLEVVTTPTNILTRRLAEANIDPSKETVDLVSKLPVHRRQSPIEWAARKALIEFVQYKRVEYQGSGSRFYKAGENVDIAKLLPQILQNNSLDEISRLGAELGLPEFQQLAESKNRSEAWFQEVVDEATDEGLRGVLITRLDQGSLNDRASVTTHFLARGEDDKWFEVVSFTSPITAVPITADQQQQLANDPQIEQALELVKGLGLVDDERIQQALNHGAATQNALRQASASFRQFVARYGEELSGPAIPLSVTMAASGKHR